MPNFNAHALQSLYEAQLKANCASGGGDSRHAVSVIAPNAGLPTAA